MHGKSNHGRGFTLVEMVVVIAIIAVLIALVAPVIARYVGTARQVRADAAAKTLYTAAQVWLIQEKEEPAGSYPTGFNLDSDGTGELYKDPLKTPDGGLLDEYLSGEAPSAYVVGCRNFCVLYVECTMDDGTKGAYGEKQNLWD